MKKRKLHSEQIKTGGVIVAKSCNKNNNRNNNRPKSGLEAASELSPSIKNCKNGNCAEKGPCKTDNCK